jgi:predicted enzyme involved in methoxymalonyl-ACP biosynthesis
MHEITRQSIDSLLASDQPDEALAQMRTFYAAAPNLSNAQFILDRMSKLGSAPMASCRVAVLRSFTIEPVLPLMRASARLYGLETSVWVGEFNNYAQEILAPDSALYRFDPQVVVLALQTRDLVPDVWQRFTELSPADVDACLAQALSDLRSWVRAFRTHSQANLILHNMEMPVASAMGILDSQTQEGQCAAISRLNAEIQRLAQEHTGNAGVTNANG